MKFNYKQIGDKLAEIDKRAGIDITTALAANEQSAEGYAEYFLSEMNNKTKEMLKTNGFEFDDNGIEFTEQGLAYANSIVRAVKLCEEMGILKDSDAADDNGGFLGVITEALMELKKEVSCS